MGNLSERSFIIESLDAICKSLERYPKYASRIRKVSAELNHDRKTTKNDPPIADVLRNMSSKDNIVDFMKKINEMSKPDAKEDTYKDLLIKRIYRGFLSDLQKKNIDTVEEIMSINKPADKLIAEIEMAARPTESLIKKIERYERKF